MMTDSQQFSDELLNAYVDGELNAEERQRIEHALQHDSELRERVDELNSLKHLVRSAYVDEMPGQAPAWRPRMRSAPALAASIAAFALGVAVTWGWFSYTDAPAGPGVAAVSSQQDGSDAQNEQAVKAVFHLSRNDPRQLEAMLNEAEALLTTTTRAGRTASVRIIASGAGLSLFEQDAAAVTQRVRALKREYQGHLIFNGCGVAYDQLKKQRADGKLELLPEMQLVDLGVLELMRRQRQGWAYIRI